MTNRSKQSRAILSAFVAVLLLSAAGCELTNVRYQGLILDRPIVPVTSMEVLRNGTPSSPSKNLGVVTVECPSEGVVDWFANPNTPVGCSYERAEWLAAAKAAGIGASGIHSIVTGTTSSGTIESLRATAFYYMPGDNQAKHAAPAVAKPEPAPASAPAPEGGAKTAPAPDVHSTVEERLKNLEKLKADNLITPEEYATKRAEILKDI